MEDKLGELLTNMESSLGSTETMPAGTEDALGWHLEKLGSLLSNGGGSSGSSFSGDYNDLTNKPTLFSGSYSDLSEKPAIIEPTQFYFAYSKTTSYDVGDIRTYDGKFYMCKTKTPYPCGDFDASYWVEVKAGTPYVGLSSAQVTGTALNENSTPKVNNPECVVSWKHDGATTSYHRTIDDDTYVYFENLTISGNTATTKTIRVNKTTGGLYEYTNTAKLLPAAPSANGTYVLKVTVADGNATYSWVAE